MQAKDKSQVNWEKAKLRVEVIAPIVSIAALLVGGFYALVQYRQNSNAEKAKETLAFVERAYKSPVLDAQLKLASAWSANSPKLIKAAKIGGDQYTNFIMETITSEKLEQAIFTMTGFYEGVALCSRKNWCDSEMAVAFFCDSATDFFTLHARFIDAKRKTNSRFAKEIEDFVNKTCP